MLRQVMGACVCIVTISAFSVGCSTTQEVSGDGATTTTISYDTSTTADPLDNEALATGSAGLASLKTLLSKLKASSDPCAILTQRDVAANKLDPSLFTSTEARKELTQGLIEVFDHLIAIADPAIRQPLTDEKEVFVQVLDVVDRNADNPTADAAQSAIESLVKSSTFLTAGQEISSWISQHCQ